MQVLFWMAFNEKEIKYYSMTKFQALYVKYLRIKCEGSWRWVSAHYDNRYLYHLPFNPDEMVMGNQPYGADLCNRAMDLLGENVEDGWN